MTRSSTRLLWVGFAMVAATLSSPARAVITPLDFAVADDTDVQAVLLEEGAWLVGQGELAFACSELYGSARWLLWTGHDGHALAVGDDGAWLTSAGGCHWRRTTGAVDGQRVVGVFQPTEGHDRILFATDDPFGGTKVVETLDGGFTSTLTGGLAIGDVTFAGLAGRGDVAVIVGRAADGELRAWWSEDAADTFQSVDDLGRIVGTELGLAGYDGHRAWCWDDGDLFGLTPAGDLDDGAPTFEGGHGVVAGDGDGVTWLAAGDEGLWRRSEAGVWEQVHPEPTMSVRVEHGRVWVARKVAHVGEPLILRSADGGDSWRTALAAPDAWRYPEECKSSVSQQCGAASETLRQGLGLPASDWEPEEEGPAASPPASGGCGSTRGHETAPLALLLLTLVAWLWIRRGRRLRTGDVVTASLVSLAWTVRAGFVLTISRGPFDTAPTLSPGDGTGFGAVEDTPARPSNHSRRGHPA